jgi:hypothetical protein
MTNSEEAQFHRTSVRVSVDDARDFVANLGVNAEFLFQLPAQGVAWLLPGFYLPAWEFPLERHGLMPGPLADQDLAVTNN